MENKNIIITLLAIIVILSIIVGIMYSQSTYTKEPTIIKITSDNEQYEGGEVSIQLTDLNKTPISKEIVNITISDEKGELVVDDVVKTDSKGKAKLDLDLKKGGYTVNVDYGGNKNCTGSNATQKLTIKEEEKVTQTEGVTTGNSLDKYRTRPDTSIQVMPSGDVVEMSPDGSIVVSVNGDPNAAF